MCGYYSSCGLPLNRLWHIRLLASPVVVRLGLSVGRTCMPCVFLSLAFFHVWPAFQVWAGQSLPRCPHGRGQGVYSITASTDDHCWTGKQSPASYVSPPRSKDGAFVCRTAKAMRFDTLMYMTTAVVVATITMALTWILWAYCSVLVFFNRTIFYPVHLSRN